MDRPPPPANVPDSQNYRLPRHIGIIMDGNGRWAKQHFRPRAVGHKAGVATIRKVAEECDRLGVHILTLYAFSTENWNRPAPEVNALMRLLEDTIGHELDELHARGVQIRILGQREPLADRLRQTIEQAENLTAHNTRAILNVAFNYGGRSEIVAAIKDLHQRDVDLEKLTENDISTSLFTVGLPDPDLIIRTAGEMRISNFLLWQSAYAEIFVTDTLWPDFGENDLHKALAFFAGRERKFGQVTPTSTSAESG